MRSRSVQVQVHTQKGFNSRLQLGAGIGSDVVFPVLDTINVTGQGRLRFR